MKHREREQSTGSRLRGLASARQESNGCTGSRMRDEKMTVMEIADMRKERHSTVHSAQTTRVESVRCDAMQCVLSAMGIQDGLFLARTEREQRRSGTHHADDEVEKENRREREREQALRC